MPVEAITRVYTVLLLFRALLLLGLCARCGWAIYRNHLESRVRLILYGTCALAGTAGLDNLFRGIGRVQQMLACVTPTQWQPERAVLLLALSNVGLLVWITTIELTTREGFVPPNRPRRRQTDPKEG